MSLTPNSPLAAAGTRPPWTSWSCWMSSALRCRAPCPCHPAVSCWRVLLHSTALGVALPHALLPSVHFPGLLRGPWVSSEGLLRDWAGHGTFPAPVPLASCPAISSCEWTRPVDLLHPTGKKAVRYVQACVSRAYQISIEQQAASNPARSVGVRTSHTHAPAKRCSSVGPACAAW